MNLRHLPQNPRPWPDVDRLRTAPVIWLGTVDAEGRPHLVPTWFSWDGESLWVFSKPNAVKVRNVRHQSRVTLAVGEPNQDFDVQLIEAVAELPSVRTAETIGDLHWRKYRRRLRGLGISPDEYVATYSQPIRIRPTRFLPWHGRGPRWRPIAETLRIPPPLPTLRLAVR
jgi:PPOX class probable F420-dependent enzyme